MDPAGPPAASQDAADAVQLDNFSCFLGITITKDYKLFLSYPKTRPWEPAFSEFTGLQYAINSYTDERFGSLTAAQQ